MAREHGLSSWAVLKETVTTDQAGQNLALAQVRWLISRFRDADSTTWVRPADEELREHFTGEFLSAVPLDTITDILIRPPLSHEDLVVIEEPTSRSVRTQAGGLQVEAFAEADPPHRLTSLQLDRLSQLVTDERVAAPPAVTAARYRPRRWRWHAKRRRTRPARTPDGGYRHQHRGRRECRGIGMEPGARLGQPRAAEPLGVGTGSRLTR